MKIEIQTSKKEEIIDITEKVQKIIEKEHIDEGFAHVYAQHTTASIFINENEKRLLDDINCFFKELAKEDRHYKHDDIEERDCPPDEHKNAPSHLKAMLFGPSQLIPIKDGKLRLGTWQSIMLAEFDGPRKRSIVISIIKQ